MVIKVVDGRPCGCLVGYSVQALPVPNWTTVRKRFNIDNLGDFFH